MATNIVFSTDEYIIKKAVGEVTNYTDYDLRGSYPRAEIGGIYDEQIFGLPYRCKCGATPRGKCPQCGIWAWDESTYLSNYAYYKLHFFIVTDIKLASLLMKLSQLGINVPAYDKDKLVSLYSTEFTIIPEEQIVAPANKQVTELQAPSNIILEKDGKKYYLVMTELSKDTKIENVGTNGIVNLMDYTINGKKFEFIPEHINAVLPIISPGLRKAKFPVINGSIKRQFHELHFEYKTLIFLDKYLKDVLGTLKLSPVDKATIMYMYNKAYNIHIANSKILKGSKAGLIRGSISSFVGSSMRWNAVSNNDLKLNECYIPRSGAYHALQSQIIDELLKVENTERYDAKRLYERQDPLALAAFKKVVDESIVIINRNPTLHRNNMLQFKPILWDNPSIGMNSYVCKSYNLDFDGDQLACYFITDEKQKALLGDKLSAENLWIFDKDHSPAFVPTPTTQYGLYCASIVRPSKHPKVYDTFDRMEADYKADKLEVDEQVKLMPNTLTTYGREKLSKIFGIRIENIIENSALDMKKMIKVIAGLIDHPRRVQIIQDLRDFGNEVATLIGIDILPILNIYKNISPEIDKVLNDKMLTEKIKLKKLTDMMPQLLKEEISKLPDNNMNILLSGARITPKTIQTLYTPNIKLDSKGKVTVGDSSILEGLSEEDYISAIHTQREILNIKKYALPRGGFNGTQLVLTSLDLKYQNSPSKETSYILVPKDKAKERTIADGVTSDIPGYVAIKSAATNNSDIIYRDEISDTSAKIIRNGARIGVIYSKAVSEFMTQRLLALKYGALLDEFTDENIKALKPGSAGSHVINDGKLTVGGLTYILGDEINPSEKVVKGEAIKAGDEIAINCNLLNVNYRLANFISLLDMKVVTNKLYEMSNYYVHKGISYAFKPGKITYKNGSMYLDDTLLGKLNPRTTYFIPDGYQVEYGTRLSSAVLDLNALLKLTDKQHAFYLFYKELDRIARLSNGINMDLAEVLFKMIIKANFSIKRKLVKQEDFITRMTYGAPNLGFKQATLDPKNTKEGMETSIELQGDNPLLKLMLRQ